MTRLILSGIAAFTLAMGFTTTSQAQERFRNNALTNTAMPTAYAMQGGTNSVTATNAQTLYSPSTAKAVFLGGMQNVPVYWDVAVTAAGAGTSNTVVGLDLSADENGVYWASNALTTTIAQVGTGTNTSHVLLGVTNGVNALSGYQWARWGYISTTQTNNVTLLQNHLRNFR